MINDRNYITISMDKGGASLIFNKGALYPAHRAITPEEKVTLTLMYCGALTNMNFWDDGGRRELPQDELCALSGVTEEDLKTLETESIVTTRLSVCKGGQYIKHYSQMFEPKLHPIPQAFANLVYSG